MTHEELMESLEENMSVIFENPSYSEALIGISSDGRAVYSYEKMVDSLCKEDNISYEDAVDFIEYNTVRALPYIENGPIIAHLEFDNEVIL